MRVVLTDDTLRDLDAILGYTTTHHLAQARRIQATLRRIGEWPESAPPSPAGLASEWCPWSAIPTASSIACPRTEPKSSTSTTRPATYPERR